MIKYIIYIYIYQFRVDITIISVNCATVCLFHRHWNVYYVQRAGILQIFTFLDMYLRHFIWKALILCLRAQIYNPNCKAAASWQKWQENSHWFKVYQKYTPLHRSRWLENALNRGFNGNSSYTWRIVTCSMWLPEGSDWDLSILMCWKNPITNYLIHECDCNIYPTADVSETLLIIMSSRMMFLKMPGLKAAGGSYWNPCLTWNPNQTDSKVLTYNESTYKIIQV